MLVIFISFYSYSLTCVLTLKATHSQNPKKSLVTSTRFCTLQVFNSIISTLCCFVQLDDDIKTRIQVKEDGPKRRFASYNQCILQFLSCLLLVLFRHQITSIINNPICNRRMMPSIMLFNSIFISLLYIETADRPGLLVEIIKVIADVNIDVESAEIDTEVSSFLSLSASVCLYLIHLP